MVCVVKVRRPDRMPPPTHTTAAADHNTHTPTQDVLERVEALRRDDLVGLEDEAQDDLITQVLLAEAFSHRHLLPQVWAMAKSCGVVGEGDKKPEIPGWMRGLIEGKARSGEEGARGAGQVAPPQDEEDGETTAILAGGASADEDGQA
jgi:hypothetical protein